MRSNFVFKDIEDSVSKFSGDDHFTIVRWLNEFEETSALLGWNNLQNFVYAKRLLTGTAKLFLRSSSAKIWSPLKNLLREEFEIKVSSGDIQRMLMKTKMKHDENIHHYILRMKEIAAMAEIEDKVIMEYIIDGVNLNDSSKMWLSDARNFHDLREKFEMHRKLKSKPNSKSSVKLEQII